MRRYTVAIWVSCAATLGLLGCSCETPPGPAKNEAFEVTTTIPANGETNVLVNGTIDIEFNHALRDEQVVLSDSVIFFEPVNPPHVVSKVAPSRIQVQLLQPLPYGTVVTAVVQGLQDIDNKPLHAYEFTFVTEIDTEPPSVPTPAFSYAITRDDHYELTGGRDPYTYIWVGYSSTLTDSVIVLSRYAEGTDSFGVAERFTVLVPLDEGANRVGLLSEDLAGNQSEPVFVTIVRDSVAPAMPVLDAAPASPTSESLLVLSGTVEADAELQVYLNGEFVAVNIVDGHWAMSLTLQEGDNTLRLAAVDQAQNTSAVLQLDLRLDTTRPVITLNSLPTRTDEPCVTVAGTLSESASVYVNGSAAGSGTSWTTCLNLNVDAVTPIEIVAIDAMGNSSQLRRYVTQGTGPTLLKTLPEAGRTVTGASFAIRYFFDQPIANAPSGGNFVLAGVGDTSTRSNHRHTVSVLPISPVAGSQTLTASYTPANSAGQTGSTVTGHTFTWSSGASAPSIAAVTATALDYRGIEWQFDFDAPQAVWFVVAVTQTSLTGDTLTTVAQGGVDDLPLTLQSPLPWAPLSLTATAYNAAGESATRHQELYPDSNYVDLGLPYADAGHRLSMLARAVGPASWELYVGAATDSSVAHYSDATSSVYDYMAGPAGFGTALTHSATTLYLSAPNANTPGDGCLYAAPLPLTLSTFTTAHEFACTDGTPGRRLHYDPVYDLLWSAAPDYIAGSDVGRIVAYDPTDASVQMDLRAYDNFSPLQNFHSRTSGPQMLLHGGQHNQQLYGLFVGSSVRATASPTTDVKHAFATGDFDGDGHDDALLFTLADLVLNDTSVSAFMYAGGYAGDLMVDRGLTLNNWDDFCVYALQGVGDLNGDGTDDLVCSSVDSLYAGNVLILWGSRTFFSDPSLHVSAINVGSTNELILARELAISVLPDITGDGRAELAVPWSAPGARLALYR